MYGAEILRAHGISRVVLVVEASGMPRAAASFEKMGIHVVPAPIRFIGGVTDRRLLFGPLCQLGTRRLAGL